MSISRSPSVCALGPRPIPTVNDASLAALGRLSLPVEYIPAFLDAREGALLMCKVFDEICLEAESKIRKFGKDIVVRRRQAGVGDSGTVYGFSGGEIPAQPWTSGLREIRDRITEYARPQHPINFVLVTLYRNGMDHVGAHSDDQRDMVPRPEIFSLSLGAKREFFIRPAGPALVGDSAISRRHQRRIPLVLEHGSLLTLRHPTNQRSKHELPARANVDLPRLNLTFRQLVNRGACGVLTGRG